MQKSSVIIATCLACAWGGGYAATYEGWVVNTAGSIQKFDPVAGTLTGSAVSGFSSPQGMAISSDGTYGWVTNFGANSIQKFDPVTGAQIGATVLGFLQPRDMALSSDGSYGWVTNFGSDSIQKIDPVTGPRRGPWFSAFPSLSV